MMRTCVLQAFAILVFFSAASIVCADMQEMAWDDAGRGISGTDLHSLAISPVNPDIVYASADKVVYKTIDSGKTWSEVLSFGATDNTINTVAADPLNAEVVYAGTAKGLYRSRDQGMQWEIIFNGIGELENTIFAITVNPNKSENVYIGTIAGIFFTENNGEQWEKGQNLPSKIIATSISADKRNPHILYAASVRGIYKSLNRGIVWERIYESDFDEEDISYFIDNGEEDVEESDITEMRDISHIRKIQIDPSDTKIIYAATSRGLLTSNDSGATWTYASKIGLVSANMRDIALTLADSNHVYAATDRGVFRYSKNTASWDEIYKGMVSSDVRGLYLGPALEKDTLSLWAVTKKGIYKATPSLNASAQPNEGSENNLTVPGDMLAMFDHEPSIEEIKGAAIEYAEVSPDKISSWRTAAANRAWLPDLRFSYDKDKDWQNSDYFYSTASEKYKDDDITRGKDSGWSVSLSWELGDLIWNSAQTSIDARSRLMVQLRDDVLNEVTRLYFERRRLQIDMHLSPPVDIKGRIEKDLRLQELTANIDALTGSYLSRRLTVKKY